MLYRIPALLFVLVFAITVSAGAASFWPMFQRDPGHTGLAPVSTAEDMQLLWQRDIIDFRPSIDAHLVIGNGGDVWVVGGQKIAAVSPAGEFTVRFPFPADLAGSFVSSNSPVVLSDGTLVVMGQVRTEGSFRPRLFAIQPKGVLRWTVPLDPPPAGQSMKSFLTLGPGGSIYAACGGPYLYKISPDSQIQWSYECEGNIGTIPAVASDGTIYVIADKRVSFINDTLYSLSPEPSLNWSFETQQIVMAAPTVDSRGRAYVLGAGSALYCLNPDGSVKFSYPNRGWSYASPALLPDGSIFFIRSTGATITVMEAVCLDADGELRWRLGIKTKQNPLTSPVADAEGNVYIGYYFYEGDPPNYIYHRRLARISPQGEYEQLQEQTGNFSTLVGGFCIGQDGTVYAYNGNLLCAFGSPSQSLRIGVSTRLAAFSLDGGWTRATSIQLLNPSSDIDADCYIAYRAIGSDELYFYPFWSTNPANCALEFKPLPADANYPDIELIHTLDADLKPGQYQWLAALFEPDTFNPVSNIATCDFTVFAQPTRRHAQGSLLQSGSEVSLNGGQMGTPPTVAVWTDKETYAVGDVLDLSLSLENEGMGMPYDLYIAATLDDDPSGTLFFFPTWQTEPALTNISFLPLGHGASLPSWTIMHLELPDALPRGGYRFLAAFFYHDTFDLASNVAEAHWRLM